MNRIFYTPLALLLLIFSCTTEGELDSSSLESVDRTFDSDDSPNNGQGEDQSGLITAGEWNDLDNWQFWLALLNEKDYSDKPDYWSFYNSNRVSVLLKNNEQPLIDAQVRLLKGEQVVWEARTDNFGKAEMWIDLFQSNQPITISEYTLLVNEQIIDADLKLYPEGINDIEINTTLNTSDRVELSFIVDATGSMSDELEFLKDDLASVIQSVKNNNSSLDIYTSSVFYRDEGDEYLVKKSEFSGDLNNTLSFINNQSAGGGGDFPEAVHTAMKTGIEDLQWSNEAKTRIAFLLLDAPPHHKQDVISDLQSSIKEAAQKGIKVIPITASGIDKETEFLMRFFSLSTNGTYVFITNDSGIGNDHIEASVGEYQVEYLNDLMIRLINKYTE